MNPDQQEGKSQERSILNWRETRQKIGLPEEQPLAKVIEADKQHRAEVLSQYYDQEKIPAVKIERVDTDEGYQKGIRGVKEYIKDLPIRERAQVIMWQAKTLANWRLHGIEQPRYLLDRVVVDSFKSELRWNVPSKYVDGGTTWESGKDEDKRNRGVVVGKLEELFGLVNQPEVVAKAKQLNGVQEAVKRLGEMGYKTDIQCGQLVGKYDYAGVAEARKSLADLAHLSREEYRRMAETLREYPMARPYASDMGALPHLDKWMESAGKRELTDQERSPLQDFGRIDDLLDWRSKDRSRRGEIRHPLSRIDDPKKMIDKSDELSGQRLLLEQILYQDLTGNGDKKLQYVKSGDYFENWNGQKEALVGLCTIVASGATRLDGSTIGFLGDSWHRNEGGVVVEKVFKLAEALSLAEKDEDVAAIYKVLKETDLQGNRDVLLPMDLADSLLLVAKNKDRSMLIVDSVAGLAADVSATPEDSRKAFGEIIKKSAVVGLDINESTMVKWLKKADLTGVDEPRRKAYEKII